MMRPLIRQLKMPMASIFHRQQIRPITVDTSNAAIVNQLSEATLGFQAISPSSLADVAPEIIKPKAAPSGEAFIANGWEEKRFRFYMEVELTRTQYSSTYLLITGFTDYTGVSNTGAIDPNMRLYFNNIVQYTDSLVSNPLQGYTGTNRTTQNNSQVIQPLIHTSGTPYSSRVRPQDVVSNMALLDMTADSDLVANTIGTMSSAAQASRARQLPSTYIANVLNASITAGDMIDSMSSTFDHGEQAYYKEMIGRLRENGFTSNPFLASLVKSTNYAHSGSVSWAELAALYPEINDSSVTEVQFVKALPDYRMNTEHFKGVSYENQAIAIIQNILPAIMTLNMIHQASFMLTNETHDGFVKYIPSSIVPMTNKINVGVKMKSFEEQIIHQLAPAIAGGNGFSFSLQVSANCLTEMMVNIRLNGNHPVEVAVPLYADSTFSCFGYASRQELDHITHEMTALTNAVSAETGVDLHQAQQQYNEMTSQYLDPINQGAPNNPFVDPFENPVTTLNTTNVGSSFSDDPFAI